MDLQKKGFIGFVDTDGKKLTSNFFNSLTGTTYTGSYNTAIGYKANHIWDKQIPKDYLGTTNMKPIPTQLPRNNEPQLPRNNEPQLPRNKVIFNIEKLS
jgi:hypothetical protein